MCVCVCVSRLPLSHLHPYKTDNPRDEQVNFGWGWGNWSAEFVCTTAHATAATATAVAAGVAALPAQARTVRLYRLSEFSLDVDFLSNHSSGDAAVRPDKHFLLLQSFPHTKLISRCGAGGGHAAVCVCPANRLPQPKLPRCAGSRVPGAAGHCAYPGQ
eukprot:COSAG03_NODE_442_length_7877_cov_14.645024_4_plen_159_part_00